MMSSSSNPGPWNPNSIYRDCSQEICSIYCPQWCSIVYPPPPPFFTLENNSNDDDSSSAFQFSPLIVALIGILASAFILITYYTVISRFCKRNNRRSQVGDPNDHPINNELAQNSLSTGLDESLIKSITVCKYIKGEGLIEGTDCSVCLSEFEENESLRLMPKCNHAFHIPCIDTWLKSNSSCPLCRSNVFPITDNSSQNTRNPPLQQEQAPSASRINISAVEFQQRNDTVIVIENSEQSCHREIIVNFSNGEDSCTKSPNGYFQNGVGSDIRTSERSGSLNSCTSQEKISVADMVNGSEDDEELQRGVLLEVGSSRGIEEKGKSDMMKSVKSCTGIKTSVSTGRFVFTTRCAKEKESILPN